MLELVFKYILKDNYRHNYQSYNIPFWFEVHCNILQKTPRFFSSSFYFSDQEISLWLANELKQLKQIHQD